MTKAPASPNSPSSAPQRDRLLSTKLHVPQTRPNLVPRHRLTERLNDALCAGCKLALVSAPAGFGKTTLLSEWIATPHGQRAVAWLSLDESDNDPVRFWTYVVTALETIQPGLGARPLALLQSPQPLPTMSAPRGEVEWIESALTLLINALTGLSTEFVVVLDDYHIIKAQPIHDAVAFLLDHLPSQMRLVIASRADPPLPLARLRTRGQLIELRAADLRFTPDEAAAFLNRVMGLGLSAEDVAALETRTEGWIAGLHLAALSLQGSDARHVPDFIAEFTGSHRYVLDYLIEEVLHRQPESIQAFLLQTSILDRLCGPLCDAVVYGGDYPMRNPLNPESQAMLERLEQANLFIVPLDHDRIWYRYHHLFAEFLRNRLRQAPPLSPTFTGGIKGGAPELHRRAAEWYEHKGLINEAVSHALAALDFERAARLIEQVAQTVLMRGEVTTLQSWLEAMPAQWVRSRPKLCIIHACALAIAGQLDAVEPLLQDAERDIRSEPDMPVTEREDLFGQIAAIRAILATYQSDVPRAIDLARQALDRLPDDNSFLRDISAWILRFACFFGGDVAAISRAFSENIDISQAVGNTLVALLSIHAFGYLQMMQGRLRQADEIYRRGLQLVAGQSGPPSPVASLVYLGLGELLRERNDLDAAARYLAEGVELGKQLGNAEIFIDGYIALAKVKQAQGDADGALAVIQETEQLVRGEPSLWTWAELEARRARLWIAQSNLAAAEQWAASRGRALDAVPKVPNLMDFFEQEIEQATLARLLIAQRRLDEATRLLDELLQATIAIGWTGSTIEVMTLQALALQAQGKTTQAMTTLEQALALTEPEGYVRIFVDEGEPMRLLIADLGLQIKRRVRGARDETSARLLAYVGRLLAAFPAPSTPALPRSETRNLQSKILVEPLSERELEVLQLVADGASNQEIAQELVIAVSTVKTHIKNICGKLDVRGRTQATTRARELGLLS